MDELHEALKELIEARKSHDSGDKYSFPLDQAKRKFTLALEKIIDERIQANNRRSQKKRIASSFIAIPKPNENADEKEIVMLDALNSCPVPPDSMKWFIGENAISWMRAYNDWYNGKRDKALKKGEE